MSGFLNSFIMEGRGWKQVEGEEGWPSKRASAFIKRTVASTFPGTPWWKDEAGTRDYDVRYERGMATSSAGTTSARERPAGPRPTRGRSRVRATGTAGERRTLAPDMTTDKEKLEFVKRMQEDGNLLNDLTSADADDLFYAIVREYRKGTYQDKEDLRGEGGCVNLANVMEKTTLVNVAKITQLASRSEYLLRILAETLGPRGARERNKCIGKELENLIAIANDFNTSEQEYERYKTMFANEGTNIRLAICRSYTSGFTGAGGRCYHGDGCAFLHVNRR